MQKPFWPLPLPFTTPIPMRLSL
jgi:hypothetical protein